MEINFGDAMVFIKLTIYDTFDYVVPPKNQAARPAVCRLLTGGILIYCEPPHLPPTTTNTTAAALTCKHLTIMAVVSFTASFGFIDSERFEPSFGACLLSRKEQGAWRAGELCNTTPAFSRHCRSSFVSCLLIVSPGIREERRNYSTFYGPDWPNF